MLPFFKTSVVGGWKHVNSNHCCLRNPNTASALETLQGLNGVGCQIQLLELMVGQVWLSEINNY